MGCHSQHHHERLNQVPRLPACPHPRRSHTSASAASSEPAPFSDHLEESGFNLPRSDAAPFLRLPLTRPLPPDSPHPQRAHTTPLVLLLRGPPTLRCGAGEGCCVTLFILQAPGQARPGLSTIMLLETCFEMQGRVKYHMQSQAG